jgi:hypothetical protein
VFQVGAPTMSPSNPEKSVISADEMSTISPTVPGCVEKRKCSVRKRECVQVNFGFDEPVTQI